MRADRQRARSATTEGEGRVTANAIDADPFLRRIDRMLTRYLLYRLYVVPYDTARRNIRRRKDWILP